MTFTFKHRSQTELQSYIRDLASDRPDIEGDQGRRERLGTDDASSRSRTSGRPSAHYGGANKAVWDTYLSVLAGNSGKN